MGEHREDSLNGCLHADWRYLKTESTDKGDYMVIQEVLGCEFCPATKTNEIQKVRRTN